MWVNKIEDIECLANDFTPDIIFISEAKIYSNDLDHMTKIDGYNLHHGNTMQGHGYARMVMLAKPNLNIEIREEWMDMDSASIWVSIKRKGHKRINLGGGYIGSIDCYNNILTVYLILTLSKTPDG